MCETQVILICLSLAYGKDTKTECRVMRAQCILLYKIILPKRRVINDAPPYPIEFCLFEF